MPISHHPSGIERVRVAARQALLDARTAEGHWTGCLSSSALSTATAVVALALHARESGPAGDDRALAAAGLRWLLGHRNADGGWGDTPDSPSNISTTALVWAALAFAGARGASPDDAAARAERWLADRAGSVAPAELARAIAARYGADRTFSVPILTMCALAGRLGPEPGAWRVVPQLPFELAACPRSWFRALRFPVVSYALPALIAMGLVRHRQRRSRNPVAALARDALAGRALALLERLQPSSGGFLEATPLTSFVVMSLLAAGEASHPVVPRGLAFLRRSTRADGSWPIDTNLATWVTTLSINALTAGECALPPDVAWPVREWLLAQQWRDPHGYTDAAPGGWAWTDLPGGVPDADDTAGALLALARLEGGPLRPATESIDAARLGVRWLLDLQNRDGGIPTFCRGWGTLPFDRSGPDLTAHALAAWGAWTDAFDAPLGARVAAAIRRGLEYLRRVQRDDGAFVPLWFGNQAAVDELNPTYGTARVASALARLPPPFDADARPALDRARRWLLAAQRDDGGWGSGPGASSSIEETALAVQALASAGPDVRAAVARGLEWLASATDDGRRFPPTPIGLYFAKLWYSERLYPLIFTVGAFEEADSLTNDD